MTLEEDLAAWVADRTDWQKDAIARFCRNESFSSEDITEIVDKLVAGTYPSATGITARDVPGASDSGQSVTLEAVAGVVGVNALLPGQRLTFGNAGLTIIYGDNASGKSGYARLIRPAVTARIKADLLGDVFAKEHDDQRASFDYRVGDREPTWNLGDTNYQELSSIRFYDEECGNAYITSASEIAYRPSAFTLLDRLSSACELVQQELSKRLADNGQQRPELPLLDEGTKARAFLNVLNASTTQAEIDEATLLAADHDVVLPAKLQEIARLQSSDPNKEKARLSQLAAHWNTVQAHVDRVATMVDTEALNQIAEEKNRAGELRQAAEIASARNFDTEPVTGVGSATWRALWEAARQYSVSEAYHGHEFPSVGDGSVCVLCQQSLSDEAAARLTRFEDFIKDTTSRDAELAERQLATHRDQVAGHQTQPVSVTSALTHLQAGGQDVSTAEAWITGSATVAHVLRAGVRRAARSAELRSDRWFRPAHVACGRSRQVENIGRSPWLIQPLSAPAGAGKTTSMRALRAAAHRRRGATVLVLAPTGKAVDVAVREGGGDEGLTIAKAHQLLPNNQLELRSQTVVIVDEAAMVGTDDLRQLLTATTAAGTKAVLVGDAHQLAPVKARGGMFAQLCQDLPWTQHLSEVWRMCDPEERTASLALRHGGPGPIRCAVEWYRTHDRLRCGDPITMAADALAAYEADTADGKDALPVCDTTEMADALNQRIHNERLDAHAPTVTGARGHRIGVGDLIMTRRNDLTIDLRSPNDIASHLDSVRNGNRWRIAAVDPAGNRVAAERLDDGARAVLENEYLREHVSLGYAVTVHTAQGVTADTTHAVLGENTTRDLLYVAMTRGRHTNTAHLYENTIGDSEYGHHEPDGTHVTSRGTSRDAAKLIRAIIANHAQTQITANDYAEQTSRAALPARVRSLLNRRTAAVHRRRATYETWRTEAENHAQSMSRARERATSKSPDRSPDTGIEL